MSGNNRDPALLGHQLDPQSRGVLLQFGVQLCWFVGVALLPALAGFLTPADGTAALTIYCSCAALFQVFIATRHGHIPGGRSLNSWDLCLALVGVSVLVHAVGGLITRG